MTDEQIAEKVTKWVMSILDIIIPWDDMAKAFHFAFCEGNVKENLLEKKPREVSLEISLKGDQLLSENSLFRSSFKQRCTIDWERKTIEFN